MNNFQLWRLLNYILDKDIYSQRIPAPAFELQLQAKNVRLMRKRLGFPESYKMGAPSPVVVDATRLLQADLRPFYVDDDFPVANGVVVIPDCFYVENYLVSGYRSSDLVSRQELSQRLTDPQTKPSNKDTLAIITATGLHVYPEDLNQVHVWYLRNPVTPVFKVKTDESNLEPVYDTDASKELEWDESGKLDILAMILAESGLTVNRGEITQYAEQVIKTGD